MHKIPKVINQIWNDANVPEYYIQLSESWMEYHPDWEYKLWTYEMARDFIQYHDPDFLSVYDKYPRDIQRIDAARYFILKELGGLFIDLDFECLKNIDELLHNEQCIFGIEPDVHCKMLNKAMVIGNAFMACTPKNNFLRTICKNLQNDNRAQTPNMLIDVLESTGPFKLTEMYNQYDNKHQIKLLEPNTIYPLDMIETRKLLNDSENIPKATQAKIDQAFAIHYFLGTWWE